jgi:hypothetical protein
LTTHSGDINGANSIYDLVEFYVIPWNRLWIRPFQGQQWESTVMAQGCMQEESRNPVHLHRDNSRFKFFYENGKPELNDDCEGALSTVPLLHMIRERTIAR